MNIPAIMHPLPEMAGFGVVVLTLDGIESSSPVGVVGLLEVVFGVVGDGGLDVEVVETVEVGVVSFAKEGGGTGC